MVGAALTAPLCAVARITHRAGRVITSCGGAGSAPAAPASVTVAVTACRVCACSAHRGGCGHRAPRYRQWRDDVLGTYVPAKVTPARKSLIGNNTGHRRPIWDERWDEEGLSALVPVA